MLRAVLFDFGGTLFSYRPFRRRFVELLVRTAREHGVDGDPRHLTSIYAKASAPVIADYVARPSYLHRELFGDQLEAFLRALGTSPTPESRDRFYDGNTEAARPLIAPRPDAYSTLAALRRRGLHVGIVSNIDDDQFAVLWERCGLHGLVDAITTSEAAGSCKPDPRIFRLALAKAAVEPSEALFVGDSATHDVAGARAVGLLSALLVENPDQGTRTVGADFVIRQLSELLDLL